MNPYRTNYNPGTVERPPRWYQRRMPAWLGALVILCVASGVQAQTKSLRLNGIQFPDATNAPNVGFNIKDPRFGAKCDGSTDDGAAILAAAAAANALGSSSAKAGVVFIPPGRCAFASMLNLDDYQNVTFQGVQGYADQSNNVRPASELMFTGTGSGTAVRARSVRGFALDSMALTYSSNSFTGTVIDFSHDGVGNADSTWTIRRSFIGSDSMTIWSANTLIKANDSIVGTLEDSHLMGASYGIRLRETNADYSVSIKIEKNLFDDFKVGAIMNAGHSATIQRNTFENNWMVPAASPTMAPAYADDLAAEGGSQTAWCLALDFSNNWVGDGDDSTYLFDNGNTRIHGLKMESNVFGSGGNGTKGLHLGPVDGGVIQGANALYGAIVFYPATTFAGLTIQGNERGGNTPTWSNIPASGVAIFNNPYQSGGNPQDDVLLLGGTNGTLYSPFMRAAATAATDAAGRNLVVSSAAAGPVSAANGKVSGSSTYTAADAPNAVGGFAAGTAGLISISSGKGGNATTTAGGTASGGGTITIHPAPSGDGAPSTNGPGTAALIGIYGGDCGVQNGFGSCQGGHLFLRGGIGTGGGGLGNINLGDSNTGVVFISAPTTTLTTSVNGTYTLGGTPTLSGTFAGTPTISSAWTWSSAQTMPALTLNNTTNQLILGAASHTDTISATAPAAANNALTIPDTGGADTFTFNAATQTLTNKTLTAPVLSGSVTGTYTLAGTPTFSGTIAGTPTASGSWTWSASQVYNGALVYNSRTMPKHVQVGDANYTVLGTEGVIGYTSITATRTVNWNPTTAGNVGNIFPLDIQNETSSVQTITITATSGTVNGAASANCTAVAWGACHAYSNGTNLFIGVTK